MSGFDAVVTELAEETADRLVRVAADSGLTRINERDHLQPTCAEAARRVASRAAVRLSAQTSYRFSSALWPRLGAVDVAFVPERGAPAFVELKAGSGRNALAACAWDAVKLAFALQLGEAAAVYLLAATPASDWVTPGCRGAEFFASDAFETLALREPYIDWWTSWERDGYPAGSTVPAGFRTRAICGVPLELGAAEWEIRVAAVDVERVEWLDWARTLPDVDSI